MTAGSKQSPSTSAATRSDRVYVAAACSTKKLAADAISLLDHLEIGRASLFGFSMGGGVALHAAMDQPTRVDKLVIGGVGDAALNHLHDPGDIEELVEAFSAASLDETGPTRGGRIRRNAELAGNNPEALFPFLQQGGWPGGLSDLGPVRPPVLLITAEDDEYMSSTRAVIEWLAPEAIVTVSAASHHDVLRDEAVKGAVVSFLRGNRT